MELTMPPEPYRYYRLDQAGNLFSAQTVDADSDQDAIAQIEGKHPKERCEIWQGRRLVAELSPTLLQA
jgi:hypothetical protein